MSAPSCHASLFDGLLGEGVIACDYFGRDTLSDPLPKEVQSLGAARDERSRDFANGRHCARAALAAFGCASGPILIGPRGEPMWPHGFVGSITHCDGYCAAAVAKAGRVASLGIDAEPHAPLPDGVLELVATPGEREWLRSRQAPEVFWDRVLFSAKESIYKACYPLTHVFAEFSDVTVEFEPARSTFDARWAGAAPAITLQGRLAIARGLVLTATTVERSDGTGYFTLAR